MAIGGGRGTIEGFALRQGMAPIVLGLGAVVLLAPWPGLLPGALLVATAFEPLVFGAVISLLGGAGWFGWMFPALRATQVGPLTALPAE